MSSTRALLDCAAAQPARPLSRQGGVWRARGGGGRGARGGKECDPRLHKVQAAIDTPAPAADALGLAWQQLRAVRRQVQGRARPAGRAQAVQTGGVAAPMEGESGFNARAARAHHPRCTSQGQAFA